MITTPLPTEWHFKPTGYAKKACPVCGYLAGFSGEHRAVTEAERALGWYKYSGRWVRRKWKKSSAGNPTYSPLPVPSKPRPKPCATARGKPKPTKRTCRRTHENARKAAHLAACGRSPKAIAEQFGVLRETVYRWRRKFPQLWAPGRDEDQMQRLVDQVRTEAGTDKVLQDPDAYLERARVCESWLRLRGDTLFPPGERPTLYSGYQGYYRHLRLRDAGKKTLETYDGVLFCWKLTTGDPPLEAITHELLGKYRDVLAASHGRAAHLRMSASSIRRHFRHIQCVLDFLGPPGPRHYDAVAIIQEPPWVEVPPPEVPPPWTRSSATAAQNGPTIRAYVEQVYIRQRPDLRESSRSQMLVTVKLLEQWAGHPLSLHDLQEDLVAAFLHAYSRGHSAVTVNNKRRHILAIWRCAATTGHARPPGHVPKMREPERIPVAWLQTEIEQLVRYCSELSGMVGEIPEGLWWPSLVVAGFATGIRVSALRSTRTQDCDLKAKTLVVRAEYQKTNRDQMLALSGQAVELIARHYDRRRKLVWPWPYCRSWFWKRFRQIVEEANIPTDRKEHGLFQRLRRSNLSYIARHDVALAVAQAGHSSDQLTRKYYLDPRIVVPVSAVHLLPELSLPRLGEPNGDGNGSNGG